MQDIEEWKVIQEFPRYMISNKGNVKSLIGKEKLLKPYKSNKGYLSVKLSSKPNKKEEYNRRSVKVHRLVAKYFCENYTEEKEVHHKNHNRQDNKAENLICLSKADHLALHKRLQQEKENLLQPFDLKNRSI